MLCCHVNKMLLTIGDDELPTFCEIYIYMNENHAESQLVWFLLFHFPKLVSYSEHFQNAKSVVLVKCQYEAHGGMENGCVACERVGGHEYSYVGQPFSVGKLTWSNLPKCK